MSRYSTQLALCAGLLVVSGLPLTVLGAQDLPPQADAVLEALALSGAAPGLAVAIVRVGHPVVVRNIGVTSVGSHDAIVDSTRFYIASSTKAFTALAASMLIESGNLRPETSAVELLPELALPAGVGPADVTIRRLLTMSSRMAYGPVVVRTAYTGDGIDDLHLLPLFAYHRLTGDSARFVYGNQDYVLLAAVMSRSAGLPWQDVIDSLVLERAGMIRTTASLPDSLRMSVAHPHEWNGSNSIRLPWAKRNETLHAAGGYFSTASDLGAFLSAMLGHPLDGTRGFPGPVRDAATTHQIDRDQQFGELHRTGWGYGWDLAEYQGQMLAHRHGGFSGYRTHLSFMPQAGIGIAILSNDGSSGPQIDAAALSLYDALLGVPSPPDRGIVPPRHQGKAVDRFMCRVQDSMVSPLLGLRFRHPAYGTIRFEADGDALILRMGVATDHLECDPVGRASIRTGILGGRLPIEVIHGIDHAPPFAVVLEDVTYVLTP